LVLRDAGANPSLGDPWIRVLGGQPCAGLDAVVLSDGTVGDDVKVIQSLDTKFGLDEQAVKASKQWRFRPGTEDEEPVGVHVTIEQFFSLRSK
jgi:TonB family protein